ncbi:hypothetical protein ACROYT_G011863 [Oculina patagonica]
MVPGCGILAGIIILKANKEGNFAKTRSLINHQLFATRASEVQKFKENEFMHNPPEYGRTKDGKNSVRIKRISEDSQQHNIDRNNPFTYHSHRPNRLG